MYDNILSMSILPKTVGADKHKEKTPTEGISHSFYFIENDTLCLWI